MKINMTDVIFGISFVVSEASLFILLAGNLVSNSVLLWVGVVTNMLQMAGYLLYEKINGTVPPPVAPTPNA